MEGWQNHTTVRRISGLVGHTMRLTSEEPCLDYGAMNAEEFRRAYTKVLTTAWEDEGYRGRLTSDTAAALAEAGLEIPAGATVTVKEGSGDQSDTGLDNQHKLWEAGGEISLYVPTSRPRLQLGDEALESVAGGGDTYCCCCSYMLLL